MNRQLRILGLGDYDNYYSAFLYGIMEGSIRCGAWFRQVSLIGKTLPEIEKMIDWFKPHILLGHMFFSTKPHKIEDTLQMLRNIKKKHGTVIFYHAGDARPRPRYEGDISESVDFGLCNHNLLELYSSLWKIPCYRWHYAAFYQDWIKDPVNHFKCDVAFTGAIDDGKHHGTRKGFLDKLKQILDVKVFPTPESGNTRFQTAELSASAESVLGVHMGFDVEGYIDVRPFQYIGAGALYFHDKNAVMDSIFEPYKHYVPYVRNCETSFQENFIRFVKKDKSAGKRIREEGFRFTQTYHSTQNRMQLVIDLVEGRDVKNI